MSRTLFVAKHTKTILRMSRPLFVGSSHVVGYWPMKRNRIVDRVTMPFIIILSIVIYTSKNTRGSGWGETKKYFTCFSVVALRARSHAESLEKFGTHLLKLVQRSSVL